jgi:hypothetical protein
VFKRLRIAFLLFILATVAIGAWRDESRAKEWRNSLHVALYPLAGDRSETTRRYLAGLTAQQFRVVEEYIGSEAARHGTTVLRPVSIELAPVVSEPPPPPPHGASTLGAAWWSLTMRWWAWRHDAAPGPKPDIRLFLTFHDPAVTPRLAHSVGLKEGRMGLVQVFASPADHGANTVVIAHELLHTLGATDKYDLATLQPRYPEGYAEPKLEPRLPQTRAELMAGRIPVGADTADIPAALDQTLIGPLTAREIGWIRP